MSYKISLNLKKHIRARTRIKNRYKKYKKQRALNKQHYANASRYYKTKARKRAYNRRRNKQWAKARRKYY